MVYNKHLIRITTNRALLNKLFVLLVLNFILFFSAKGQIYPVSVTTQLTPPYSVNLADYAAPGCEQLKVIIVQRDLTQAPYRMYLKMEISLNGQVIMRTVQGYMPFPLTLEPGLPTVISGSDLYPFLDPKNIDFIGYSRETYIRTKSLPEGAYVITFTAYDYARPEVALSAGGSMYCYLAKADPPLLNLPVNNTGVTALPSQYIMFQWLPRTTSSPNSAFTTKYKFELFEIRLDGRSPAEIVQSSKPIYSIETDQSTLAYTIANPPLETGMRYAWRVRAFDTEGRDYIRNNGYSEVFNFVYGVADAAALPGNSVQNFVAEAVSARKGKLSWDASADFDSYKVYYRIQGDDNKWYEEETIKNSFDLAGLSPGTVYECRVQGKKNAVWGGFSATDTMTTLSAPVISCGSPFQAANITNREPLKELHRLQEIDAGGFMVTVIEANGGEGNFSGKGFVQVPLFANTKIRCAFNNISLNTDYQLLQGDIQLLSDDPDGTDNALWDVDAEFEGGKNNGTVKDGTDGVSVLIPDVVIPGPEAILLDTASREILVVTASGDTVRSDVSQQLDENAKTITVKDEEGNLYSVDTQTGKATSIGKAPAEGTEGQVLQASTLNADKGIVYFEPAREKTKYAMDVRNKDYAISKLITGEYKTLTVPDGTPYDIPFKLIPVGETDVVLARAVMKDKTLKADSVVFQSSTGTRYASKASGKKGEYLLTLPSGKDNDGIDVYAVYPNKNGQPYVLGKLSVISYSTKRPKVVLVPVNGNTLDAGKVKEELDKVYIPVAVDWQVSLDEEFNTTVDSLKITNSGLFSMYTEGMKKLNSDFIAHKGDNFDASALYLFVLRYSGEENATGDMPRSKQFGYLFTETAKKGGNEAIYRTIAHEVSHGIFRLKHTFDSQYDIAKASTQNLMDYTGGTELVKHQWDAIHEPGLVIGMFEGDEDGMMSIAGEDQLRVVLQHIGINGCAFCKECAEPSSLEGGVTISLSKKNYRCTFGELKDNGTIESRTSYYNPQISAPSITLEKISIPNHYKQFVVLINKEQNSKATVICEANEDYSTYCAQKNPFAVKTFTEKVVKDIQKCAVLTNYSGYKASFAFKETEKSPFEDIKKSVSEKLENTFFNNVKLCVELTNSENGRETLFTKGLQNCTDADIKLRIHVDNQGSKVFFDIDVSDNYLQEYVSKWQQKAANKGYDDIDVEALRNQVITELESTEVQGWFGKFCQTLGSLVDQKIGGFVEALQTSQKIGRNIWDEGQLPEGTWHSNNSESGYSNYPKYAQFTPAIPGACDAIIDEIMGIPLIVKTGYQLMTDSEQQEAFSQVFTKNGLKAMKNGLSEQLQEFKDDEQKQEYAVTNASVTVVFAVVTGGGNVLIKGGKKLLQIFDVLEDLAQKFKACTNVSKYINKLQKTGKEVIDKIAKVSSSADKVGVEQVEKLTKEADNIEKAIENLDELSKAVDPEKIEKAIKFVGSNEVEEVIAKLHKLKDVPGINKVMDGLGEYWTKYLGGKFVLEYTSKLDGALLKKLEFEVPKVWKNELGKEVDRFYDFTLDGVQYELKAWEKWASWSDDVIRKQFIKDLANPELTSLDKLQWVFKKTDGITDEVLKKNVIKALQSKAGKEALKQIPLQKVIEFTAMKNLNEASKVKTLINYFKDVDNFRTIFKVVD